MSSRATQKTKAPARRRNTASETRVAREGSSRGSRGRGATLASYNAKRNLQESGEPAGGAVKPAAGAVKRYVIQKHDATRLHYDFRLEMDGVYRSWAVPKGIPTERGGRSLAVEVEDHPLEYGSFEGVIPAGNYGAGTVMLWDRGHYTVSGVTPEEGYRQGKMHMALAGEKCVGEWTLVRMPERPGDKHANWLLIKNHAPEHEAPMHGADRDLSVLSGRSLDQIASGEPAAAAKRAARAKPPAGTGGARRPRRVEPDEDVGLHPKGTKSSKQRGGPFRRAQGPEPVEGGTPPTGKRRNADSGAKAPANGGARRPRRAEPDGDVGLHPKAAAKQQSEGTRPTTRSKEHLAPARFIPPMKALSVDEVPKGKWRLEIKLDGYRALAVINDREVELWSRNHKPLTAGYPEVVEALKKIPCVNAVIDGEIVALDAEGRSRFQLLQNRDGGARPPIVYYVFDLLHHDGRSLLNAPIEERQIALEVLVGQGSDALRFSPVFEVAPEKLLAQVRERQLEGVIAKTPGSVYEPDRRSGTWLKCKVHGEQEFVIGGFTPPKNSRAYFGAILVGYYEGGKLLYAGKVGSGFNTAKLASLHREFLQRKTTECPFANLPSARKSRFGTGMTASVMRQVTWVKPELVAQVQFTEWTEDGSLRHPVFLGLRDDKKAKDVVRESGADK